MKKQLLSTLLALCLALALLPAAAFAADADSGTCGTDMTYTYSDGVLTIEGTGLMRSYIFLGAPWSVYRNKIHTIIIGDGVTTIGGGAFMDCVNLTSVTLPGSLTGINNLAFEACRSLTDVFYGGSEDQWAKVLIGQYNGPLSKATKHFTGTGPGLGTPEDPAGPEKPTGPTEPTEPAGPEKPANACGDNVTWTYSDGVLTVSGTGEMDDYKRTSQPWYNCREEIHTVIIGDGVTSIGEYAFTDCSTMTSVTMSPLGITRLIPAEGLPA